MWLDTKNQDRNNMKSAKGSILIIFLIWILPTIIIGGLSQSAIKANASASQKEQEAQVWKAERDYLVMENQELKDKLERSAKIETSNTTKKVAEEYIKKYFPEPQVQAQVMQIVKCESNFNNLAFNKNKNGSVDKGVFQINSVHAKAFKKVTGFDYEVGANDFDANVKYARYIYDTQHNFSAWVCSRIVGNLASK